MVPSLICHIKIADSSGGSGEAPFEGVEICNFNLVSDVHSFTHLLVFLLDVHKGLLIFCLVAVTKEPNFVLQVTDSITVIYLPSQNN